MTALIGCSDVCENQVASRTPSPDGRHDAVIFQRSCGATTGFSTQISIVDRQGQPYGGGNVLKADDNRGAAAKGTWKGPWAEVEWVSDDRLLVRYAARSRIFEQASSLESVKVDFREVER